MPLARGAKVLHLIPGGMPWADAAFYEYACVMNLQNWEFVPESMRSDKIFDATLASPWNAPEATTAHIPPLVLQLGPREDCDNKARVLAAAKHSGYNLQFASPRLRADASVVAWAAATEEVKEVTVKDAREINMYCQSLREEELQRMMGGVSVTDKRPILGPNGLGVPGWKAAAYFAVPEPMRERLWPWRQHAVSIFIELQREGKMPTPDAYFAEVLQPRSRSTRPPRGSGIRL